mmetsp:Transcript_10541/g.26781  ORF Transcript_10541/g.26781 Transcript_10541/m.26781 type:complete len:304 (-) Transcript_10541:394-1305(-)
MAAETRSAGERRLLRHAALLPPLGRPARPARLCARARPARTAGPAATGDAAPAAATAPRECTRRPVPSARGDGARHAAGPGRDVPRARCSGARRRLPAAEREPATLGRGAQELLLVARVPQAGGVRPRQLRRRRPAGQRSAGAGRSIGGLLLRCRLASGALHLRPPVALERRLSRSVAAARRARPYAGGAAPRGVQPGGRLQRHRFRPHGLVPRRHRGSQGAAGAGALRRRGAAGLPVLLPPADEQRQAGGHGGGGAGPLHLELPEGGARQVGAPPLPRLHPAAIACAQTGLLRQAPGAGCGR